MATDNGHRQQQEPILWTSSLSRAGERARHLLFIIAFIALVIFGLGQVTVVVVPLLLAVILASAIAPFVNWLRRHNWPDAAATGTAFILLIIAFGAVILGVVVAARAEWSSLAQKASKRADELFAALKSSPLPFGEKTLEKLKSSAGDLLSTEEAGNTAMEGAVAISEVLTGFVLMAVILFFLLKDGARMWAFCIQPLHGRQLAKIRLAGIRSIGVLGGYIRGTAIVALVDAVLIGVALLVLGVPLALPLAVLIFIGAFIPIIGATATGILAAGVALIGNGPIDALIVIVVIIVVNQVESHLLQPLVMGRTLHIHPLIILVALACGAVLAGILGAILAVPLTAVGWAILRIWATKPSPLLAAVPKEEAGRASCQGPE